jgi:hypothetical protein
MKSTNRTLRQLIADTAWDATFKYINKKDQKWAAKCDRPSLETTTESYRKVLEELTAKPKAKPYKMPIFVRMSKDFFNKTLYVDVCFLNPKYEAPAKGLKPWGGKPPEGHYNCNLNKHSQYFAFGWTPWSKIIDTPVELHRSVKKLSPEAILGEILWELTFNGWSEEDAEKKGKEILSRCEEAKKDIKEGKFVELPPKKKGDFKVVIPDCVQQQIKDIMDKSAT